MSMKKQSDYAHLAGDDSAVFMTRREFGLCPTVAEFTLDGEPISKARARFTKRGSKFMTYTPEKTLQGEAAIAAAFRKAAPDWEPVGDRIFGVFSIFFAASKQRRDVDNMTKLVLDALNGVAWVDDAQVYEISSKKQLCPPGHQRTAILIYDMGAKPQSFAKCAGCDNFYVTYPSWDGKRSYCSNECRERLTLSKRERTCEGCGTKFYADKTTSLRRYCTKACVYASKRASIRCDHCDREFSRQASSIRKQNFCGSRCAESYKREHPVKIPNGTCQSCGSAVSRREYTMCGACQASVRGIGGSPIATESPFLPDNIRELKDRLQ